MTSYDIHKLRKRFDKIIQNKGQYGFDDEQIDKLIGRLIDFEKTT